VDFDAYIRSGKAEAALWWSMAAGAVAWSLDLGLSYSLTQHACSTGHHFVLHVISIFSFVIALTGAVAGFRMYQRTPDDASRQGGRPRDRAFFIAAIGITMSIAFAVVIIAFAVPRWILSPCD
jgi:uncharacterized membrane protein YidH (DUF202 family)